MSTVGSDELTKLFSTSMNHTNDCNFYMFIYGWFKITEYFWYFSPACINVLAFLISFLGPSENMTKEGEQDWNDVDKAGMRREFFCYMHSHSLVNCFFFLIRSNKHNVPHVRNVGIS